MAVMVAVEDIWVAVLARGKDIEEVVLVGGGCI